MRRGQPGRDSLTMAGRAQTIIVGYDGSEGARRALDRAAELMGYGGSLAVVYVVPSSGNANGYHLLDEARALLNDRLLSARTVERFGDPTQELVQAARELHADLLVIGDGETGPRSVGTRLIHEAPCDVLIVK
jgi:nucleotide-binding universal stress UspA family protein